LAYYDSSLEGDRDEPSALEMFDPLDHSEDDQPETREPLERPPAGSLLESLLLQIDDINIARYIDPQTLDTIGQECLREYEIDNTSRADWEDKARKAMQFAMMKTKPKVYPWPGASSTIYPLITQACLEFHSRITGAIMPGKEIVKGIVWGSDRGTPVTLDGKIGGPPRMGPDGQTPLWLIKPGEKRARAERVGEHMSWQLLDEMKEWAPQTDAFLLQLPAVGGFVRKTFRDPAVQANCSLGVSLANLVWNYHAPSFDAAPRHTEKILLYPNQIIEYERAGADESDSGEGMFLKLEYASSGGGDGEHYDWSEDEFFSDDSDDSAPQMFLEQHRLLDLDEDGYSEPYVVTLHRRSGKVVRIVSRYTKEGIDASSDGDTILMIRPTCHYTLYPFLPSIDGGSYPIGFGHLLRTINAAINTTFNQLFDSGHLANANPIFIGGQLDIPSGQSLFQVGRGIRVNTKGGNIRDSVVRLPIEGPNMALFQVLGALLSAGKEIGGIAQVLTGDAAIANAPPTTILALIEQGLKGYTAIAQRVFRAEKEELAKLYDLNRLYLTETAKYRIGDEWREVTPEDYRLGGGVEPVTDPTMATDMQKLARAQILIGFKDEPGLNKNEILRRVFEASNEPRIDDLFVPPDPEAAQMAQQAAQLAIAMQQAELGKLRAGEMKDQTQAFLNMALARKNADTQQQAFIEAQLDFLRLHIEALNTTVKAAAVDHKFHDTNMRATTAHAQLLASGAGDSSQPSPADAEATPGPTGPFPTGGGPSPPGPDVVGPASLGTGNTNEPAGPGAGPAGPGNPAPGSPL
jgi:chaperonin GroES